MRCWQIRGLLAAWRSLEAQRLVMVSPWMVRLAWEACLGGWNEGNQFGWFGVIVEEIGSKGIGVHIHLGRPWQEMNFHGIVLVAFDVWMLK
jgi:hypothetical protein